MELSKQDILHIRQQVEKADSRFSEKKYLESLGSPGCIIGRKSEAEKIVKILHPSGDGFSFPFVSVFGKSGTGKSTVTKFVCSNLPGVSFRFVNLRRADTHFGCANLILQSLDGDPARLSAGINSAINGIQRQILEILAQDRKSNFVLILDEFDAVFSDKRRKGSDFLYKLFALSEELRSQKIWLCIVAISNSSLKDYFLEERVRSRTGDSEVYFPPYTKKEILEILESRAQKAFAQKPDREVLSECAFLCSAESGDCRHALHLLQKAVEIADGRVTKDDVLRAYKLLNEDYHESIVHTCTGHQKALLLAMARLGWKTDCNVWTTKDIADEYKSLRLDAKHLGYRRVFDLLDELENLGIIISQKKSDGRLGYHKTYQLQIHHDIVGYLVSKDNWYQQVDHIIAMKKRLQEFQEMAKERQKMAKCMERKYEYG